MVTVCGLDLSGKEESISGFATIENGILIYINSLHTNKEILEVVLKFKPKVIAIDAPLSHAEKYRLVDLRLRKLGLKVLPPGWKGMRTLVSRALKLKEIFEKYSIEIIETHPLSAIRYASIKKWHDLIKKGVIRLAKDVWPRNKDEEDAVIAATVAWLYVLGKAACIKEKDGKVYLLPKSI